MLIIAAFAAMLVGAMVALCQPCFQEESEDPQALQQWHGAQHAT